jgi:Protein of unknown function (DUF4236)
MGFRFRRSIRILPGLRLNLGKRGASVSIGGRGAHITVGHGQVRETVGLPGSGLSYTATQGVHHHAAADAPGAAPPNGLSTAPQQARRPRLPWAIARLAVFAGMMAIAGRIVWFLW